MSAFTWKALPLECKHVDYCLRKSTTKSGRYPPDSLQGRRHRTEPKNSHQACAKCRLPVLNVFIFEASCWCSSCVPWLRACVEGVQSVKWLILYNIIMLWCISIADCGALTQCMIGLPWVFIKCFYFGALLALMAAGQLGWPPPDRYSSLTVLTFGPYH